MLSFSARSILARPTFSLGALPRKLTLNTLLQVIGAAAGLGGQVLVTHQNPAGFVLWLVSSAALMWLQLRLRLFVLAALSLAYFGLSVQGLSHWNH
jgi:hypothetical protein